MKNKLLEELNRIHFLSYGIKNKMQVLKEQNDEQEEIKQEVLDNLEEYLKNNTLSIDIIKSIQSALIALGYPLPRFGVDGKIGPETLEAIKKFNNDNPKTLAEDVNALRQTLDKLGYSEKGNELTSGGDLNSTITDIATEILSTLKNAPELKDSVIQITAGNDAFHKKRTRSKHNLGLAIDFTVKPLTSTAQRKVNQVLNDYKRKNPKFSFIDEYANPSKGATGGHFHMQLNDKATSSNNGIVGNKESFAITPSFVKNIHDLLKSKNKLYFPGKINKDYFIDLNTPEGYTKYKEICDKFISEKGANPLRITGDMLARAATDVYKSTNRYVSPELALSQLVQEGGIGNSNISSRPIRTKNPYNVGNTETGSKNFNSVQDAINAYFRLIADDYLDEDIDSDDLIDYFVNKDEKRYASDLNYETNLKSIANMIKNKYY